MRKTITAGVVALMAVAVPGVATADEPPPSPSTVLLVTGDRVTVGSAPDGRRVLTTPPGSPLVHLGLGGRDYEVPLVALPYFGNGLDPSLFDVDALRAAEQDGRIPLVGVRPGTPGVTMTGQGEGYLTASSTTDFRDVLAHRAVAGTLSLPGQAPAPAKPRYVMHTVTIAADGPDGAPAQDGEALLFNVDDGSLTGSDDLANVFTDGTAKFSVPAGHYSVLGLFWETDANGTPTGVRISARPEVTVSGDATFRVDATAATSEVSWRTPKPATPGDGGFLVRRAPAKGQALTVNVPTATGIPIRVSPTHTPVRVGELQSYPYRRLTGDGYEYQLQKAAFGVIPEQHYVVTEQDLAVVRARFFAEVPSDGLLQRLGFYDFEDTSSRSPHPIALPSAHTEYFVGDPAITWLSGLAKSHQDEGGFDAWFGGQYDTARRHPAGERHAADWNAFPLHPAGETNAMDPDVPRDTVPMVTRDGDLLRVGIYGFSDNEPGHLGVGSGGPDAEDRVRYTLDQNGVRIDEQALERQGEIHDDATLSAEPTTLTLAFDAVRGGPRYGLSTHSHTEWTWRSSHEDGGTLPNAYLCEVVKGGPQDRSCSVEPLLTLRYGVAGLDLTGTAPGGTQTLDLHVGHLQLADATQVTAATVQFSLDDGTTWQDATVSGHDGDYRATFDAAGGPVSLRVTATDAAGGRISETIDHAYQIG